MRLCFAPRIHVLHDALQPGAWSYVQVQWNASHAQSYVNSSLCGSVESGYNVGGTGWGSGGMDNVTIDPTVGGSSGSADSLLVGAWRGAPDGVGADRLGGYYTGLLDNLEVRVLVRSKAFRLEGG